MSTTNRTPPSLGLSRAFERVIDTVVGGVQAVAFWTAALLPLALIGAVLAGGAGPQLDVIGGGVGLTLVSAALGHGHSPN